MKTLCLIRHAKTSWSHPSTPDIERPLEERGISDVAILSNYLSEQKLVPDLILASPALRTKHTAELLIQHLKLSEDILIFDEKIYNAAVENLLKVLQNLDDKINTVFLIGHNPGITMLANYLAEAHIPSLQTSGAFSVQINSDHWHELTTAEAKFIFEYHPPHEIE